MNLSFVLEKTSRCSYSESKIATSTWSLNLLVYFYRKYCFFSIFGFSFFSSKTTTKRLNKFILRYKLIPWLLDCNWQGPHERLTIEGGSGICNTIRAKNGKIKRNFDSFAGENRPPPLPRPLATGLISFYSVCRIVKE
jgi:hypothetical protein